MKSATEYCVFLGANQSGRTNEQLLPAEYSGASSARDVIALLGCHKGKIFECLIGDAHNDVESLAWSYQKAKSVLLRHGVASETLTIAREPHHGALWAQYYLMGVRYD